MTATTDPHGGWLARFLLHPDLATRELAATAARVLTGPWTASAGVAAMAVVLAAIAVRRAIRRRLNSGARLVTVLIPPTVDPAGAAALWRHLTGRLRPSWQRIMFGQPHFGFEYTATVETGSQIRLWVPGCVPPGSVERAVQSAWPGVITRTEPAEPPPLGPPSTGQVWEGGELRLRRRAGLPIRADDNSGDLVRALLTAATDLAPGQATCVQILARPASRRRTRRATRDAAGSAGPVKRILRDLLDLVTVKPLGTSAPATERNGSTDRQAALERTAQTRAAALKTIGAHFDTVVRYAVTVAVDDTDPHMVAKARGTARGRAGDLAAVFGTSTGHNFYRRRRRLPSRLYGDMAERRIRRGDLLSVLELAGIASLPQNPDMPGIARAGARAVAPAPSIPTTNMDTKPLGSADAGSGRAVALGVADARHHLHVVGPTGVGKSTLLARMILADATASRGLVVIDPKGDLVADVLDRLPSRCAGRVVLFDAESTADLTPCVNPLDTRGVGVDLAVDNLVTIFHRIYAQYWGPRTDDVFRSSLLTLCAQPGTPTLVDLVRLLGEPAYRARVTRAVTDPILRGFWNSYEESERGRTELVAPLLNKLRAFLLRPFVRNAIAAGPSTVDLGDVLDHGGICLARLPKGLLGEDTTRLVGSLLVARTWQAATARARIPGHQRRDAALYLDEAHNFLHLSTPVADMLSEARGLRLSLTLAHQNLGQLSRDLRDAVSANARNKIMFTASPEDARELARHTTPALTEHDLANLNAYHAAARLMVKGQQAPPFTLETRPLPPPEPHHGHEIRAAIRHAAAQPNTPPHPDGDPRRS